MKTTILSSTIDERFLHHRLRSTSIAGIACGALAIALFGYRYFMNEVWSWDLLVIGLTFVAVKMVVFVWLRLAD